MQKTKVWSLDGEDPLEKGIATHSRILVWRIPWTEEPGRLQSMGLQSSTWLRTNTSHFPGSSLPPSFLSVHHSLSFSAPCLHSAPLCFISGSLSASLIKTLGLEECMSISLSLSLARESEQEPALAEVRPSKTYKSRSGLAARICVSLNTVTGLSVVFSLQAEKL